MNHTVHAATILDHQRAADLARENEMLRRQADRAESLRTDRAGALAPTARRRRGARRSHLVRGTRIAATH
jgi:hypothetical protein